MNFCVGCEYNKDNEYEYETQGNKVFDYDLCEKCIKAYIRICTCDKKFIAESPKTIKLGKKYYPMPESPPDCFFTHLQGDIYHIYGCRGCQHKEISVVKQFEKALQASIESCVYQKIEDDNSHSYRYVSDSLEASFEEYLIKNRIKVGEPTDIKV